MTKKYFTAAQFKSLQVQFTDRRGVITHKDSLKETLPTTGKPFVIRIAHYTHLILFLAYFPTHVETELKLSNADKFQARKFIS